MLFCTVEPLVGGLIKEDVRARTSKDPRTRTAWEARRSDSKEMETSRLGPSGMLASVLLGTKEEQVLVEELKVLLIISPLKGPFKPSTVGHAHEFYQESWTPNRSKKT